MNNIEEIILEKIKAYDTIIIHRHIRPDGDAIGSSLGLREVLRTNFPNKKVYSVGDVIPQYLSFVGSEDQIDVKEYEDALVIVVDTANASRVSLQDFKKGKEIIKIDHHIPVEDYGDINYVKENYGSCTLIITELCKNLNLEINENAARYLYIGTITDTGRFKFKEVDGNALRLASILLDKGVDTENIYANLYSKDANTYKLQGYVYNHIKYTPSGVAYLFMTKRIMKKFAVSLEDASNCVNLMDGIKGSMIWLLFIEHDNEIRVRLRSRFVPINNLANMFNGGGHAYASGATIKKKNEIKKVLNEANKILEEYKKNNKDKF